MVILLALTYIEKGPKAYLRAMYISIGFMFIETLMLCGYGYLNNDITYTILNKLCEFEDIVIISSTKKDPHLITNYIYELATLFHSFYTKEKIITEDETYTNERINLLLAIKIVINNALNLIGIIPREEM